MTTIRHIDPFITLEMAERWAREKQAENRDPDPACPEAQDPTFSMRNLPQEYLDSFQHS